MRPTSWGGSRAHWAVWSGSPPPQPRKRSPARPATPCRSPRSERCTTAPPPPCHSPPPEVPLVVVRAPLFSPAVNPSPPTERKRSNFISEREEYFEVLLFFTSFFPERITLFLPFCVRVVGWKRFDATLIPSVSKRSIGAPVLWAFGRFLEASFGKLIICSAYSTWGNSICKPAIYSSSSLIILFFASDFRFEI